MELDRLRAAAEAHHHGGGLAYLAESMFGCALLVLAVIVSAGGLLAVLVGIATPTAGLQLMGGTIAALATVGLVAFLREYFRA